MKKIFVYISALLVVGVSPVFAQQFGQGFGMDSLANLIGDVLGGISTLFVGDWIRGNQIGFSRFLLWVLVFSVFYFFGIKVFAKHSSDSFSGKKLSLIVSLVFATSTALFTPNHLVESMFASQVILTMFIPIGFILYAIYGKGVKKTFNGAGLHAVRLIGLLISFAILTIVMSSVL